GEDARRAVAARDRARQPRDPPAGGDGDLPQPALQPRDHRGINGHGDQVQRDPLTERTTGDSSVNQSAREETELDFWRTCTEERGGARSLTNLVNKLGEARWLLTKLDVYAEDF